MTKLLYQGHGSLRIHSKDLVIYIDPFIGLGYDLPADIILVTHQHEDHNDIGVVLKKTDCQIISNKEALVKGRYRTINTKGVCIIATEAYNNFHRKSSCVGFIVIIDNIKLYFSGDTSQTKQMASLSKYEIDYAFFCGDGIYNMGPEEASLCAKIVNAKHNSMIHNIKPSIGLFDFNKAKEWDAINKLVIVPGEEIILKTFIE